MWFVFLCFLVFLYFFYSVKSQRELLHQFPTPPANLILGHVLDFAQTKNILQVLENYTNNYGKSVTLYLSYLRTGIVTADYKFVEFLLSHSTQLTKSENYMFLRPWLGKGLLLSDGQLWRKHRKIITPAFHFQILNKFVPVFESVGDILIEKLQTQCVSSSFDLYPLITLCTLDIICETAMGTKINAQKDENSQYAFYVKELCRISIERCLNPLKLYNCTYIFFKDYHKQKNILKFMHNYTRNVINIRLKERERKKDGYEEDNFEKNSFVKKKSAFLDLLLEYSNDAQLLDLEEIQNEVDTFMFEGHDTTASAISFTLFCLANNPEVQEKVIAEQRNLFGNIQNPEVKSNDLQNMKYLDIVIKEALRLYPPVPVVGRMMTEHVKFDGGIIPEKTSIAIFLYGIHRNPDYFPEPEQFRPDRFDGVDGSLPYAYIPFSAGSRNCIGQKFATLEMKSVVSKVIRNFELLPAFPDHKLVLVPETVLTSSSGIKVGIRRRVFDK